MTDVLVVMVMALGTAGGAFHIPAGSLSLNYNPTSRFPFKEISGTLRAIILDFGLFDGKESRPES